MPFESVVCDIAGIATSVACETAAMHQAAREGRGPFLVSAREREPEIRLEARLESLSHPEAAGAVFVSGGLWTLHRAGRRYQFTFTSEAYGDAPYKVMIVDDTFSRGEILLNSEYFGEGDEVDPLQYPADELLWIHRLSFAGGVELHACGVVDVSGDGYLFLGHSGAGKSTIAKLWESQGATVLSDDRIVVRPEGDGFAMFGTPWHGEAQLASVGSSPVRRVFFIEHGDRNELSGVPPADAVTRFFVRCFPAFHDASSIEFDLGFYERFATATPCHELRFVPDQSAIDFVRGFDGRTAA